MLKKILSTFSAALMLTSVISIFTAPTANAVAPVIASTSTISSTQANPSVAITTSASSLSSNFDRWAVGLGTTGLTLNVISTTNGNATLTFSGTATCGGTITIRANAAAFLAPLQTQNSNTLSFEISSAGCVAPVIASTSTITAGQVNPTIVLTSTSTFRANPDFTNANFSISAGGTNLTKSVITLAGNTITMALTGTAQPGTLVLTASGAAFNPNPGSSANTLQFVVAQVPATSSALTFQGGSTQGPIANGTAPRFMNGGNGEWNVDSSITWSPSLTNSRFAAGVVYTATVDISPSSNTFEGLSSSFFTFSGATSVSATYSGNPRTSATVAIVFPATAGGSSSTPAICTSEQLSSSSTIKGIAFDAGTRQASSTDFNGSGSSNMGSITLTEAQASGNGVTSIVATGGATATWLHVGPSIRSWGNSDISTTANLVGVALANGELFEIKISGSGCADYYRISITVESEDSAPTLTEEEIAAAAAATAEAQAAAVLATALATAKVVLTTQFSSNKPVTLQQFLDANYGVRNSTVAANVSAAILKLSVADRDNSQKINEIISFENFIDRVAVLGTRSTVRSSELVSRGLLPAESAYKHSVIQGLASYPDGSLNSLEKIAAAVTEQIAKAEAPKRRLAEIKAQITARKK